MSDQTAPCPYCNEDMEIYTLDADQHEWSYFNVQLYRGKLTQKSFMGNYCEAAPTGKWYRPYKKSKVKKVSGVVHDRYVHYCKSCHSMMVRLGSAVPRP